MKTIILFLVDFAAGINDLVSALTIWLLQMMFPRRMAYGQESTPYDALVTAPTLISLTRGLILGPAIWWLPHEHNTIAMALLLLAVVSDKVDGCIARVLGSTRWGTILDPLCDRIFFFFFALGYWRNFDALPLIVMLTTEALILALPPLVVWWKKIGFTQADWSGNIFGKLRFVVQLLAMAYALAGYRQWASGTLWLAFAFALLAIAQKAKDTRAQLK